MAIIGFACGVFDLFHAGHVLMLEECKQNCDFLVVAVNKAENFDQSINKNKRKPIFSFQNRTLILNSCIYVDEVMGYDSEDELLEILSKGKFDIRFLGEDYRNKKITGEGMTKEVYYTSRSHGLSTSLYREKILNEGKN